MLFVNGNELQVGKDHRVFEQGMRADDDLYRPTGETGADLLFVHDRGVTHQQANLVGLQHPAFSSQQGNETSVVLFGQDGGGSHDGCLRSRLVDHGSGQGGHHRLAGTDIPLQQAVHRLARSKVHADICNGFILGFGEGKGQCGGAGCEPGILHFEYTPGNAAIIPALAQHAGLQKKDLIKGQTLAGGLQFGVVIGEVDLQQSRTQIRQPGGLADRFGQVIGQFRRPVDHHLVHEPAQPFLGDISGEGIHRHDPVGVQVLHLDRFPIGVGHHQPAQVLFDPASDRDGFANFQTVGQPGLVEPGETQPGGAIVDDRLDHGHFSAAQGPGIDRSHFADDGDLLAVEHVPDGLKLAVIIITAGKIVKHIAQRIETQACEHAGMFRPHAYQYGKGSIEGDGSLAGDTAWMRLGAPRYMLRMGGRSRSGSWSGCLVLRVDGWPGGLHLWGGRSG